MAAALLSASGILDSSVLAGTRSSYICPVVLNGTSRLRYLKTFNLLADSALLVGVTELCRIGAQFDDTRRKRTLASLGAGLLVSILLKIAVVSALTFFPVCLFCLEYCINLGPE